MKTKSIIPGNKDGICFACGRYGSMHEHHLIEGSYRAESERFGLKVNLCPTCHEMAHHSRGRDFRDTLHKIAQTEYEEMRIREGMSPEEARDSFRKHFNKSIL